MVETLAPAGYAGRLRTTLVACATFTAGALVGGVITFGGLGLLGQWLGAGGTGAAAVAAAVAIAAAIGEARGVRIVPQVRRQVPESWRRVMPVPLAAGLYGVLLGLGFTTFILTFAVWALAAVSVALGDPQLGAVLGLAFGAGRALPVILLAPGRGDRPRQRRPRRDGRAPRDPARAARRRRGRARRLRGGDDQRGARRAPPRSPWRTATAPSASESVVRVPAARRHGLPPPRRRHLRPARPRPGARRRPGRLARRAEPDRARHHRHAHARRRLHRAGRRPVRVQRPLGRVARRRQAALRPAARLERRAARGRPRARDRAARPPVDRRRHRRLPPGRHERLPDPPARPGHRPSTRCCAPSTARC